MSTRIIFLIASFCWMASCSVSEYDDSEVTIVVDEPEIIYINDLLSRTKTESQGEGLIMGCLEILFPFSVIIEDSLVQYIESEADFIQITEVPGHTIIDFQYPISIKDQLGVIIEINELWALAEAFGMCFPDDEVFTSNFLVPAFILNYDNSCFTINYPIEVQNTNFEITSINNEALLTTAIAKEALYYVFPLQFISLDSQIITVHNEDEFFNVLYSCNGDFVVDSLNYNFGAENFLGCYTINYPFRATILGHSNPVDIIDEDAFIKILYQGRFVDFVYPITVYDYFGGSYAINSHMELDVLLTNCDESISFIFLLFGLGVLDDNVCFDIEYPFSILNPFTQKTFSFTSRSDLESQLESIGDISVMSLVYPIIIIQNGQQHTINNIEDLLWVLSECN